MARLARGGDSRALGKLIETNAGLAYRLAIKYSYMNKASDHMDDDDLLQAALMGLTEAAKKYDPEKGHKFATYAEFWMRKRLSEEVRRGHWATVRPPERFSHLYLSRFMDDDERTAYETTYMLQTPISEENGGTTTDDMCIAVSDVLRAVGECDLTMEEELVFLWIHEPDTPNMSHAHAASELGISVKQVKEHERQAIDKLRECLGIQ